MLANSIRNNEVMPTATAAPGLRITVEISAP